METQNRHRSWPVLGLVPHVRRLTLGVVLRELSKRILSQKTCFGLRADLSSLPDGRSAKIALEMAPCEPADAIDYFDAELDEVRGADYGRILTRKGAVEAGVWTPYFGRTADRTAAYVQWLVTADEQDRFHAYVLDKWPWLEPDEVFLEFAYTFVRYRKMGVMNDAMARLLQIARDRGARAAITYVRSDNVGSLRGCANVGFELDHVREMKFRLGRRLSMVRPVDAHALDAWKLASARTPAPTRDAVGPRRV